jgi:ABC-2 type transport system permease protein
VFDLPTLVFFVSMIVFWLFATVLAIDQKKAQ